MKKLFIIVIIGLSLTAFSQDSTNTFDYLYKRGISYYNKGVDSINKAGMKLEHEVYDTLLIHYGRENFKNSLPFLLKAYSVDSKNEKVLIALQGVYFSMYDFEESERYKNELESLKKKK